MTRVCVGTGFQCQTGFVAAKIVVDPELIKFDVAPSYLLVAVIHPIVVTCAQTDESLNSARVPVLVFSEGVEHLRSTLRVAHHCDFWLAGDLKNLINER